LSAAAVHVLAMSTMANRMGHASLAKRLATLAKRLESEVTFLDNLLGRLP